jgi:hypothetical protein
MLAVAVADGVGLGRGVLVGTVVGDAGGAGSVTVALARAAGDVSA